MPRGRPCGIIKVFTESGQPDNVAYEVHGASTRFVNNNVLNLYQGVWVASNDTSAVKDIIIQGNAFGPLRGVGVDFYRMKASERPVTKVIINSNTFHFSRRARA